MGTSRGLPDHSHRVRNRKARRLRRDRHARGKPRRCGGGSRAIPGFFEPVPINGRRYVDGGLNSLCHLDLLEGSDLDVVLCFSAMTAPLQRPGAQLLQRAVQSLFAAAAEQLDRQVRC